MNNNRGFVPVQVFLIVGFMGAILGIGLKETHDNGILKNNVKTIWCKMQNKGEQYCDSLY